MIFIFFSAGGIAAGSAAAATQAAIGNVAAGSACKMMAHLEPLFQNFLLVHNFCAVAVLQSAGATGAVASAGAAFGAAAAGVYETVREEDRQRRRNY